MTYLVINLTSYGIGYDVVGTLKSKKRAEAIVKALTSPDDAINGASWHALEVQALDRYTDDSIVAFAKAEEGKQ